MNNKKEQEEQLLDDFQLRHIQILTHLMAHDAIDDEIVENLRKSELDYFALLNKYHLLEQKVNIDEKTNLLKYKNDYLTEIIKTASRIYFGTDSVNYHVSFIRFDIDDFSIFNNKYGHETGDRVLITIADIIRSKSRPTDYAIRFGGEEFDVILPATTIDGAVHFIEKIYKEIHSTTVRDGDNDLSVTISAGISSFSYTFEGPSEINDSTIENCFKKLQSQADDALYEAKSLGKDRFCIYDEERAKEYEKIREGYCS